MLDALSDAERGYLDAIRQSDCHPLQDSYAPLQKGEPSRKEVPSTLGGGLRRDAAEKARALLRGYAANHGQRGELQLTVDIATRVLRARETMLAATPGWRVIAETNIQLTVNPNASSPKRK